MPYKLWNTALDPSCRPAQRQAARLQVEPVIGGKRLRLRSSMEISDELFTINKSNIDLCKSWGVLDWAKLGNAPAVEVKALDTAIVQKSEESALAPSDDASAKSVEPAIETTAEGLPELDTETEVKEESSQAETTPAVLETEPQPKSPFKGKKKL